MPKARGAVVIDPRLVFFARCWARHVLVEADEITLDEAFDGLVDGLERCPLCDRRFFELADGDGGQS